MPIQIQNNFYQDIKTTLQRARKESLNLLKEEEILQKVDKPLNDNENLFVSKYQLYLPTEEKLKNEIEKDIFELRLNKL